MEFKTLCYVALGSVIAKVNLVTGTQDSSTLKQYIHIGKKLGGENNIKSNKIRIKA